MKDSATTSAAAAAPRGGDCGRHHRHDCVVPRRTDVAQHTCFYFTVFFSNNPPIFHSNRIPPERLGMRTVVPSTTAREEVRQMASRVSSVSLSAAADGSASSASPSSPSSPCTGCQQRYWKTVFGEPETDGAARPGMGHPYANGFYAAWAEAEEDRDGATALVGDYRSATATVEEVPQQTLQNVAFPTAFGSCGGACMLPVRTCGRRTPSASAVPSPKMPLPAEAASPQASPSKPQPPPPQFPSAADTAIVRAADAEKSTQEATSECAQKRVAETLAISSAATNNAPGPFSSTTCTLPLRCTATPAKDASPTKTVAGAPTIPDHCKPTLPAVKWEDEDNAAVHSAHNEGTATSTIATESRGQLGQGSTQLPRLHVGTDTMTSTAEGETLPPPQQRPTPTAAPAAALNAVPITSAPAGLRTSTAVNCVASHLVAHTSAGPRSSIDETGSAALAASAPIREGPPWNMRVEEVRSAKGELRYYRIILTASFAALVTTHIGLMHSMQTRNAATALVVLCPPCGLHFRFLLHHADILRSVLNRTTEFAIRTVQRFFCLLYSPTQKPKGSQQQVLKGIAALLEAHPEGLETYRAVKTELTNALCLRFPLPMLALATSAWAVPVLMRSSLFSMRTQSCIKRVSAKSLGGPGDASSKLASGLSADDASASVGKRLGTGAPPCGPACSTPLLLDEILHEAASFVREYSEGFASAFICGLLSLTESAVGSAGLRSQRRVSNNGSITAGVTAAAPAVNGLTSPDVSGVPPSPSCTQNGSSPIATHEASPYFSGGGGAAAAGSRGAPAWLSPYAAYWSSITGQCSPLQSGEDSLIDFGKPAPITLEGYDRASSSSCSVEHLDADAALTAHVSTSKITAKTPVVSPLRMDAACAAAMPSYSPKHHFLCEENGTEAAVDPAMHLPPAGDRTTAVPPTSKASPPLVVSEETFFTPGARRVMVLGSVASSDTVAARSCSAENSPHSSAAPRTAAAPAGAPSAAAAAPHLPPKTAGSSTTPSTAKEDEYLLHLDRLGRVVIFTRDAVLARQLLIIAAFLWNGYGCGAAIGGGLAARSGAPGRAGASGQQRVARSAAEDVALRNQEAQHMYETAVAAAVSSAEYANVPVQWVAEEFSESCLSTLCSRFSPENALLVVVPRQLQCRRVYLRKYVTGTTVLVEEHSGKGARICTTPFPFRCSISKQVVVQPDPTVATLLREACSLHQSSLGSVSFADVFQRMIGWLHWQSAAALSRTAAAVRAASAATTANGSSLTRFVSSDAVWPSSDVSIGSASASSGARENNKSSHITTPVTTSPETRLTRSTNKSASSTVYHCDSLWEPESVEENLLPGSMGGVGAWSHSAGASVPATGGATATAKTAALRAGPMPATSKLLVSHGLLQPPAAFTSASHVVASPVRTASFKLFQWLRSSPTSPWAATTHSHPVLSPAALGHMQGADGVVGGQRSRLLAGADGEEDVFT
ncbi:conserved hypothetical protein [Leishmania major strain Friedlin]|uniref:Uncharacterized protein n=1 Tax=Leishmania major TaxID=5664 RepID=Q4QC44_LEIMA|nr:conserved hypothetical protein [Leishmania major strain Friedlin]CAG9573577.1 hypothetical_protein_-_conserved [Leishmania major strain Friedlin]CAJ04875.1 conserved hypothetical protein [Leishmania major strain Friedlin]|eukprot:XP_001683104.1 conserved hypothetical protein [Leishmania major strain Friedlin]